MLKAVASSDTVGIWNRVLELDSHGVKIFVNISKARALFPIFAESYMLLRFPYSLRPELCPSSSGLR